ncbi:RAD54B protein [Coccidioides immitis RMSCC 3703]|uniref:RAD54B protein n=1 Tax=Coccidioides immitis RMSCC 3703 TaxID=454286 RepID=A0A0J8QLU1_COCIT|nr:RAD54B protein [Coccidioides immitis RMSCC 3703]
MPFKPFKPPLIRRPPSAPQTQQDTSDSVSQPSAKRRRIGDHASDVATEEGVKPNGTVHVVKSGQALYRKPLILANNSSKLLDKTGRNDTASGDGGDGGVEGYYNVLWRKFTAKKHRTWDGDGILSLRGGYAYLQDVSGKDMGRIMFNSPLKPGSALSIGGKDVEVDSILSKEEYLAGRPFLGVNRESPDVLLKKPEPPRMTPISVSRIGSVRKPDATKPAVIGRRAEVREAEEAVKKVLNVAAPKSIATNSRFKNPLKEDSVLPSKPNKEVTPRHDPNQPGAIVMKRPESVPKGKQIVDVVVDPLLGKHLREHQREGVKLLYECVMGMRPFNGEGAILADEMGLGKTLQTIALLWTLMKQNPIYGASPVVKKALIVCPVTLIKNWQKEFRKWLGNDRLGVFVADGKHMRLTDFTMGMSYNVMIIGYERLRTVQEELAKGRGIDIVIADEGHRLKTVQNKSAQAIQSLNTARRIILSGTPIQNDLTAWCSLMWTGNPGDGTSRPMARIHRDGQKRHCHIYRMLLRGGLEEKIWQRQVTKLGLADSVMDQKNSVAHFSREELRDLFRLDEDAECQTHDLLGCECGGRGKHASIIADVGDNGDKLSDSESPTESDDSDEIPDPPSLIKASKLLSHPSAGERKNAANKRRRKMRSLMQYSHISTQLLVTKHRKSLEEQIGDDVLLSLLGEEGNGVRYLFKRDGFAGLSTNTDKMGI